jgi:hypothetical protein
MRILLTNFDDPEFDCRSINQSLDLARKAAIDASEPTHRIQQQGSMRTIDGIEPSP